MHTNSLPPTDREDSEALLTPEPAATAATNLKTYPCNAAIREKLRALRASSPLYSNGELGKKLQFSAAVISRYLSEAGCLYNGNIAAVEQKAADFLQALERRRASGIETHPSHVADQMLAGFEYIRKTNDLGAIVADSGDGKTRGIELIRKKHALARLIEFTEWCRSVHDTMRALWKSCAVDGWDRNSSQFPYLVQKMTGSDIPLIFDDAHKASKDALSLIATFQEKTGCPCALIGLPELVKKLESDPQLLSRTGLHWALTHKKPDPKTEAKETKLLLHMVRSVAKDCNGELDDLVELCTQVSAHHGHKRAVHKQLKVAAEIRHANDDLTWCEAFRQAHTLLLRQYALS